MDRASLSSLPNGTIDKVINYTRGNILAVVDIYIVRNEDTQEGPADHGRMRLKEYAAKKSRKWWRRPVVQGLDRHVKEMGFELRAILKVLPMTQWKVKREVTLKSI